MSPVRFEQPHDALRATEGSEFFGSELGAALEQAEMVVLRRQLDDCFGARALLLGAGADERLLDALHVQRRFVARIAEVDVPRRSPVSATHAVIADPGNLPYANGSFDVVILFHALDLAAQPHQALREAARVLADGGRLVITGFNPWSLWGIRRLFGRRRAPWNANFLSPVRMIDWLSLLGFTVSTTEFACYRPPLLRASAAFDGSISRTLRGFVRMPFGGVWIIRARLQPPQTTGLIDAAQPELRGRLAATAGPAVRGQAARGFAPRDPGQRRGFGGSGDGSLSGRSGGSNGGKNGGRNGGEQDGDHDDGARRRSGNVFPFVNLHDRDG